MPVELIVGGPRAAGAAAASSEVRKVVAKAWFTAWPVDSSLTTRLPDSLPVLSAASVPA